MTDSEQKAPDWEETVGAWLAARWQWLVVGVLLLFALNNLVGVMVGAVGLIAFAHRIAGRLLGVRRVVEQIQQITSEPEHSEDDV